MTTLNSIINQQKFYKLEVINHTIVAHVLFLTILPLDDLEYEFKISSGTIDFGIDPRRLKFELAIQTFKDYKCDIDLDSIPIANFQNRLMASRFILTFYPSIIIDDELQKIYKKYL